MWFVYLFYLYLQDANLFDICIRLTDSYAVLVRDNISAWIKEVIDTELYDELCTELVSIELNFDHHIILFCF
jgi:hypothetical protein